MTGALVVLVFLGVLSGVALWRWRVFEARWRESLIPGVRFRRVGAPLGGLELSRLRSAALTLAALLRERWPDRPELLRFAVEVVDVGGIRTPTVLDGRLADGSPAGGSIRPERAFPGARTLWVAVITRDRRAPYFLSHELTQHILAEQLRGQPNAEHALPPLTELEREATKRVRSLVPPS